MLAKVNSGTVLGIEGRPVQVEVDITTGMPKTHIVGLPDKAVREAGDRVRSALKNSGYDFPVHVITINLAPADLPKAGSAFDLPVALGVLAALGTFSTDRVKEYLVLGELALDGMVRPIQGVLPLALLARETGKRGVIVPADNALEAAVVEGVETIPVKTLGQCVDFLAGATEIAPVEIDIDEVFGGERRFEECMSEVRGQEHAKRALEVAAAGGHNVLMVGPPGSGKTMLAKRIPGILPDMTFAEALETTKIYSVAGLLPRGRSLIALRPFRAPHHTVSDAGLIGGGAHPKAGEVSLAHNGVLFLDELPEFKKNVLEVLRQPVEDGEVTISRALMRLTYPADFMFCAAMNPCPCGYLGDAQHVCSCSPQSVQRYLSRISGPLLDRIDIQIEVGAVKYRELTGEPKGETSPMLRERVQAARDVQKDRFKRGRAVCNAQMSPKQITHWCKLDKEGEILLERVVNRLGLSARAYTRILKVARTIADLDGAPEIATPHLAEAVQYRNLDRRWGN